MKNVKLFEDFVNEKYTIERAIADYTDELENAKKWKEKGDKIVTAMVAGEELAKGRNTVPIDEYIKYWETKLAELKSGKDSKGNPIKVEDYNY